MLRNKCILKTHCLATEEVRSVFGTLSTYNSATWKKTFVFPAPRSRTAHVTWSAQSLTAQADEDGATWQTVMAVRRCLATPQSDKFAANVLDPGLILNQKWFSVCASWNLLNVLIASISVFSLCTYHSNKKIWKRNEQYVLIHNVQTQVII